MTNTRLREAEVGRQDFFTYNGNDAKYFHRARLGAVVISAYSRVIATETNREALRLSSEKTPAQLIGR